MILIILYFIFLTLSFNLIDFYYYQKYLNFFFLNILLSFVILIIFLAETNRAPFDFAEGESELVSGFNTEYGRGGFALIFLSEYARILFLRFLFCLFFFMHRLIYLFLFVKLVLVAFLFIWVRGAYPRFRYDKLIYLTWKIYLSFSLNYLLIILFLKLLIFYFISL